MRKVEFLLPLITVLVGIGSVSELRAVPFVVVVTVIAVSVLIVQDKIAEEYTSTSVYWLALMLIWQTSMYSQGIVGVDNHTELSAAKDVIASGWDYKLANGNNTSIVIGLMMPLLVKMGIASLAFQFKALIPVMYASVPVMLFQVYRKMLNNHKYAYLGCLFLMIMPMYSMEMVSMAKGMIAQVFLIFGIWIMFIPDWKHRLIYSAIALVLSLMSHYSVGVIGLGYVLSILVCAVVGHKVKFISRLMGSHALSVRGVVLTATAVVVAFWSYFSVVGEGCMLVTIKAIGSNLARMTHLPLISDYRVYGTQENPVEIIEDTRLNTMYLDRTQPETFEGTYLHKQEPMIRTALGFDWNKVSITGKMFRVLQYTTQALLLIGFFFMFLHRKRYQFRLEYTALVLGAYAMLAGCVFVPFLSTVMSATRFYYLALLIISPVLVIGIDGVFNRSERSIT